MTTIPTGEGLTFEKVWAMFQESDRKFQEEKEEARKRAEEEDQKFRERMEEEDRKFSERMEEEDRKFREQMKESDLKFQEKIEEARKRAEEEDRKLREQMKETDRKIGELSNRFGELAEHLVAPGIVERFNELGYRFDKVATKGCKVYGNNGKEKTEIDILLENGDCIMAVEVKSKPKIQNIPHHIKRLEILREFYSNHHDTRKIYGAIAGAIFGNEEKQAAFEAGFYVLVQSGDTMKIEFPCGFTPSEW